MFGRSRIIVLALVMCGAMAQGRAAEESPLTLRQTVQLPQITGGTNHLAADAKRRRFFVTAPGEGKVVVVDLKAGKVLQVLPDVPASAACFLPDLDQLCLSGRGKVRFYAGDSLAPIGSADLGSAVDELAYEPKQKRLYVGLMDPAKPGIGVIDPATRRSIATIKMPAKPQGFVVDESGTRLYANTPGARQVTVLDLDKRLVAAEWKLTEAQSNYPIALDGKHHRLFVGCRRPARVLILDAGTGRTITGVETGGDADDMSFDSISQCAYLACGDGTISTVGQIDSDHYRHLADTPTGPGARNSLFVPELKTFFVAIPQHENVPAELRAYTAGHD